MATTLEPQPRLGWAHALLIVSSAAALASGCKARLLDFNIDFTASLETPVSSPRAAVQDAHELSERTRALTDEENDSELATRLSRHVSFFNDISTRVAQSRRRYLSWIKDATHGPTGKERTIYGLYCIDADASREHLSYVQTLAPELASAALEYSRQLNELVSIVKVADLYYSQHDYADDNMAKGKALHPRLLSAFEKFASANAVFTPRVSALHEQVLARQLARNERTPGREFEAHALRSREQARALVAVTQVVQLKEIDAPKLEAAIQRYDISLGALDTDVQSQHERANKLDIRPQHIEEGRALLRAAKDLLRRARDNRDFNKEFFSKANPRFVDGHPDKILDLYKDVIRSANAWKL